MNFACINQERENCANIRREWNKISLKPEGQVGNSAHNILHLLYIVFVLQWGWKKRKPARQNVNVCLSIKKTNYYVISHNRMCAIE